MGMTLGKGKLRTSPGFLPLKHCTVGADRVGLVSPPGTEPEQGQTAGTGYHAIYKRFSQET